MRPELVGTFWRASLLTLATVLGVLPCAPASAQETRTPSAASSAQSPPSGRDIPRPDQLEPGVNTTPPAPAPSDPMTGAVPTVQPSAASAQPASPAPPPAGARKDAPVAKATGRKGPDRIELDTTDITGNRELPKVLYIVPWKHSELGDPVGKPVNSLLDEVLQPLDRDVFRRENRYYDGLKNGGDAAKTGAAQGAGNNP